MLEKIKDAAERAAIIGYQNPKMASDYFTAGCKWAKCTIEEGLEEVSTQFIDFGETRYIVDSVLNAVRDKLNEIDS